MYKNKKAMSFPSRVCKTEQVSIKQGKNWKMVSTPEIISKCKVQNTKCVRNIGSTIN